MDNDEHVTLGPGRAGRGTDRGRARSENQDVALGDSRHGLFVVADGMSDSPAGGVAASLTVDTLADAFRAGAPRTARQLGELIDSANRVVWDASLTEPGRAGMRATVCAAVACDGSIVLGWAGDSRCYRLRAGVLDQLTVDTTVAEDWIRRGVIGPDDPRIVELRLRLLKYVGVEGWVNAETMTVPLRLGDRFLVCTDGLHHQVADNTISGVLAAHDDPDAAVAALLDAADAAGGHDNVTAIVFDITHRAVVRAGTKRFFLGPPDDAVTFGAGRHAADSHREDRLDIDIELDVDGPLAQQAGKIVVGERSWEIRSDRSRGQIVVRGLRHATTLVLEPSPRWVPVAESAEIEVRGVHRATCFELLFPEHEMRAVRAHRYAHPVQVALESLTDLQVAVIEALARDWLHSPSSTAGAPPSKELAERIRQRGVSAGGVIDGDWVDDRFAEIRDRLGVDSGRGLRDRIHELLRAHRHLVIEVLSARHANHRENDAPLRDHR